jgi:2',3'-cyclic-nucleotide 2'-phosphodiesterase (5'-nucleotidase family)
VWNGTLTTKTILSIFPYNDIIITAKVIGEAIWNTFENSVSKLPGLEVPHP